MASAAEIVIGGWIMNGLLMQMVWLKSDTVKSLWNLSATVICPIIYLDIVSGDISKKHEDEERIGEVLIQPCRGKSVRILIS